LMLLSPLPSPGELGSSLCLLDVELKDITFLHVTSQHVTSGCGVGNRLATA